MRWIAPIAIAGCAHATRPPLQAPQAQEPDVEVGLSRARELANSLFVTSAFFATVTAFKAHDAIVAQERADWDVSYNNDAQYQVDLSQRNHERLIAVASGGAALAAIAGGSLLYLRGPSSRLRPRRPSFYGWKLALADLAAASAVGLAFLTYRPEGEGEFAPHPDNTLPAALAVTAVGTWAFAPFVLHATEDEPGHALSSLVVRGTAAYVVSRNEPSTQVKVGAVLGAMVIDDVLLSLRCSATVTIAPLPGGATAAIAGRF